MKFNAGLILATLLFLPGCYALIVWIGIDMSNRALNWPDLDREMKRAVPMFGLPITTRILVLIALSILGLAVGLNMPRGETRAQRSLRIFVIVLGVLTMATLTIPLM
ncbi:MAG: hypothetical protein JWQ78_1311 [Sediminibacterium sp.]|nr:hypothetical protein [Sediminibacterium sp.]